MKRQQTSIKVHASYLDMAQVEADKLGITRSRYIEEAIGMAIFNPTTLQQWIVDSRSPEFLTRAVVLTHYASRLGRTLRYLRRYADRPCPADP